MGFRICRRRIVTRALKAAQREGRDAQPDDSDAVPLGNEPVLFDNTIVGKTLYCLASEWARLPLRYCRATVPHSPMALELQVRISPDSERWDLIRYSIELYFELEVETGQAARVRFKKARIGVSELVTSAWRSIISRQEAG